MTEAEELGCWHDLELSLVGEPTLGWRPYLMNLGII